MEITTIGLDLDEAGEVIAHHKPVSWLQEPQGPLDLKIELLTGLADADLQGKSVDAGALLQEGSAEGPRLPLGP